MVLSLFGRDRNFGPKYYLGNRAKVKGQRLLEKLKDDMSIQLRFIRPDSTKGTYVPSHSNAPILQWRFYGDAYSWENVPIEIVSVEEYALAATPAGGITKDWE